MVTVIASIISRKVASAQVESRRIVGRGYRYLKKFFTLYILWLSRFLLKFSRGSLTLGFNNYAAIDGTGAQIQRLMSVRALAIYLNCGYQHFPIINVSVHPLDPFQNPSEVDEYLRELNRAFNFETNVEFKVYGKEYNFKSIRPLELLRIVLRVAFLGEVSFLKLLEPYPVSDSSPEILRRMGTFTESFYDSESYVKAPIYDVVIHYRQGVGGFVLYPGQKIPRQLPLQYFGNILTELLQVESSRKLDVCILTDSPPVDMEFRPPRSQVENWDGTPNFENGSMFIEGMSFDSIQNMSGLDLRVVVGGNPIDAIAIMAKARNLLISRSSLSYVAGVLNREGRIYYPRYFWHPPFKGWNVRP